MSHIYTVTKGLCICLDIPRRRSDPHRRYRDPRQQALRRDSRTDTEEGGEIAVKQKGDLFL